MKFENVYCRIHFSEQRLVWRNFIIALTILITASFPTACVFKGNTLTVNRGADVKSSESTVLGSFWQPRPVNIRILPTTKIVREGESQSILRVRIELLDAMKDATKASGQYLVELYASSDANHARERLHIWQITVMTIDDHIQYYDPVTRAYLLPLQLSEPWRQDRRAGLHVQFAPESGDRLTTSADLAFDFR